MFIPLSSPRHVAMTFATCLVLLLAGCASTPAPVAQMAVAEAAVQSANTPETAQLAGAQLQLAISKLGAARSAQAAKDYVGARRLADEAQLDAQAAVAHAQSARSRQAAADSQAAARALDEEMSQRPAR